MSRVVARSSDPELNARFSMASSRSLSSAPKPQVRRFAALALGFLAVTRHRVAVPWLQPVDGPLRGPDEIVRAQKMRQRPRAIIVNVAHEPELALRLQHARHCGNGRVLYEASFPMPSLRPGIGMDQVDPEQRSRGQPRQEFSGVAG